MSRLMARSVAASATALVLVALGAPSAGAASRTAADGAPATGAAATTPISHLVVMTQDDHSFDNYFGTRAGVDGIPKGVCAPAVPSTAPCVPPFPLSASGLRPTLLATAAAQQASVANGLMNGFVQAQTTPHQKGTGAMGYYLPSDVPVLTQLADEGVLFDHWFSALPGGSIANRVFAMSGTVVPDTTEVPAGGWPNLQLIFDRLQAAGVSWKIYVEHYQPGLTIANASVKARHGGQVARVPLLAMSRFESNPALKSHVVDLESYFSDLASGSLPAVSWIVTTSSTERPPADPQAGQREVSTVVNALGGSSAWSKSAFVLTYDSSGGWYDHVAPPVEQGAVLGLRVPALLISPYATPGRVDSAQFDSGSVLRFIETNWSLASLTPRDANATDLGTAMSFSTPPHAATIVDTAASTPLPVVPDRGVIYGAYALAALLVAGIVAWAAYGGRRRAAPIDPLAEIA